MSDEDTKTSFEGMCPGIQGALDQDDGGWARVLEVAGGDMENRVIKGDVLVLLLLLPLPFL